MGTNFSCVYYTFQEHVRVFAAACSDLRVMRDEQQSNFVEFLGNAILYFGLDKVTPFLVTGSHKENSEQDGEGITHP
jgi:hypothetical protein